MPLFRLLHINKDCAVHITNINGTKIESSKCEVVAACTSEHMQSYYKDSQAVFIPVGKTTCCMKNLAQVYAIIL